MVCIGRIKSGRSGQKLNGGCVEGAIGTAGATRPGCPGMLIIVGWPALGVKVGGDEDCEWGLL